MTLCVPICKQSLSPLSPPSVPLSTTVRVTTMSQLNEQLNGNHKDAHKDAHKDTHTNNDSQLSLATPYLYRRESGRYYYRLRPTGSLCLTASVSLGTTERTTAMKRYNHLSATMKAFMLDNDSATFEELREHLKDIAQSFLNEKAESYWSGVNVDQLYDAKCDLREIVATQPLNDNQHRVIIEALKVISAAQDRVNKGDAEALLGLVGSLSVPTGVPTIINTEAHTEAHTETPIVNDTMTTFKALVDDLMLEKRLNLKPSSVKDLESTLKTVSKYVPDGCDLMSRLEWLSIRDSMVAGGLAASTINKAMTKAKMLLDYGLMNQKLTGRNPIERMKLNGAESLRKAFSEGQLKELADGLTETMSDNQRYLVSLGMITGARIGELTQLTAEDIKEVEGHWCIDINDDNGKTVKNKASLRVIPLTDGAYGFSLKGFLEFTKTVPTGKPLLGMSRDTASKWFNESYMKMALSDTENVTFHSLRHSMASNLKAAGVNLIDAQGVLGHSSQSITFDLYGKGHAVSRLADALKAGLLGSCS